MAANNSYETVLIFSVKSGEESAKTLVEKFKAIIEENGTIDSIDEWGSRKLAYLIEDEAEGYYAIYNYSARPDFIAELERIAKITEGVLRVHTVKK